MCHLQRVLQGVQGGGVEACRRRDGEAAGVQVMQERLLLQTVSEFSIESAEFISHRGLSDEPLL